MFSEEVITPSRGRLGAQSTSEVEGGRVCGRGGRLSLDDRVRPLHVRPQLVCEPRNMALTDVLLE